MTTTGWMTWTSRTLAVWVLLIAVFFNRCNLIESVTINPNTGGYSIAIAVNENVPEPQTQDALDRFINNIRDNFQRFTNQLFIATRGYFFIENVQVVLPATWNSSFSTVYPARGVSYSASDIRLSADVFEPAVSNPNPCGQPGNFIELPATFFSGQNYDEKYGPLDKAFITQWARFRWGVWEEHGYPEDTRFPYFYRDRSSEEETWRVTGCSDVPLDGGFTNTTGQPCEAPDTSCRFRPTATNVATTSLMGFHWLHSTTQFCDESTHNRIAPNKQNLFCNHRSVWDVIQSSPDFQERDPADNITLPNPNISVVRPNVYPLFHLVLDRGIIGNQNGISILTSIIHGMGPLFDSIENTIGAVTVFESNQVINLVSWTRIGDDRTAFMTAIGNITIPTSGLRDFSNALFQVANDLAVLQPTGGAVVLIVKTGAVDAYFNHLQREEEIVNSFVRTKTRVFAAEIETSSQYPFLHLNRLAQNTGGAHTTFNNLIDTPVQIEGLTNVIAGILNRESTIKPSKQLFYKGQVEALETHTLTRPAQVAEVKIHLTTLAQVQPIVTVDGNVLEGVQRNEWDEAADPTRRIVHTYSLLESNNALTIQYDCNNCNNIASYLLVEGVLRSTDEEETGGVTVELVSNAMNNVVDFAVADAFVPFAIYVTVKNNSQPVANVLVEGIVVVDGVGNKETFSLLDDGLGSPDIQSGDGIFSGVYIPPADGFYVISVRIQSVEVEAQTSQKYILGDRSRLLPIDQEDISCSAGECDPVNLEEPYSSVFYLPSPINFRNVDRFVQKPIRVLDFSAVVLNGSSQRTLSFTFSSPRILGNSSAKATNYTIYGSNSYLDLVGETANRSKIQETRNVAEAGLTENFTALMTSELQFQYYILHASYGETDVRSNIAEVPYERAPDEEGSDGEDTVFFKSAGGVVVIVLIVLVAVGAVGGGAFYYRKRRQAQSSYSSSP